jgi:hypothetical protein
VLLLVLLVLLGFVGICFGFLIWFLNLNLLLLLLFLFGFGLNQTNHVCNLENKMKTKGAVLHWIIVGLCHRYKRLVFF